MSAKKRRTPAARLPVLRVEQTPPVLDGTRALVIANAHGLDLLVNSDIWRPAHDAASKLFGHDDLAAMTEHSKMQHLVCGDSSRLYGLLEQSEWTRWRRLLQAAYIVGISVGQRLAGGR